jgi:hypothetical protein
MMHVKNKVFSENQFAIKKHIRKIAKKFKGDTQRLRAQLINELRGLANWARDKVHDDRVSLARKQKCAQLAANISRVIAKIAKEYDSSKILSDIAELYKIADEIDREREERNSTPKKKVSRTQT